MLFRSQLEEQDGDSEARALVAIDERAVLDDPVAVGCGHREVGGLAVREQIRRPGERRQQQALIADSGRAAELAVSRDGRFLYVSNRGTNVLLAYAIDRRNGALTELQRIDAVGKTPWSFGIDPTGRWMVVTNEVSDSLDLFAIDRASGRLSPTGERMSVPKPVVVAFLA